VENANIHRGVHTLSAQATDAYEDARKKVADFINAPDAREVIFVRGTTEGINLVAHAFSRKFLKEGDEILISTLEHHSNIVPWQVVAEDRGARLRVIPVDDRGVLDLEAYHAMLSKRTAIVALTHVSNAIGTVNPVEEMIRDAHAMDIPVLIDGAQAAPHFAIDMHALDCDFYTFSGHKMYGPTGIGVLYGKSRWLDEMPPYEGGGGMIRSVDFEKTIYRETPEKFEAGTPNIAGAIGLGAAVDFLASIGLGAIHAHEQEILAYVSERLRSIDGLRIIGTAPQKESVLSFVFEGVHPHDIGTFLDTDGIAIRTGHHCAQPLMKRFGIAGTARASFGMYNTKSEVDKLVTSIRKIIKFFRA